MNDEPTSPKKPKINEQQQLAEQIFTQSLKCYMAKTIKAFEDTARENSEPNVHIKILALEADHFKLLSTLLKKETYAYILTKELKTKEQADSLSVEAKIYINQEATDAFVKFIIMHELWHLHKDLAYNKKPDDDDIPWLWKKRPLPSKQEEEEEENECNHFAWLLSHYHNQLYTCDSLRKIHKQLHPESHEEKSEEAFLQEIKEHCDHFLHPGHHFLTPISIEQLEKEGLKRPPAPSEKETTTETDKEETTPDSEQN